MENEKMRWSKVVLFAGAVIAFTIGSGFATGQEILQYFAAYGYKCFLVVAVYILIFVYTNYNFAKAGNVEKFEKGGHVFQYFCGKYVGTAFEYFAVIFCYMSYIVMIGGAAATIKQQYGLPSAVGGILLMVTAGITVIGGLNTIVDSLGKIGPVIVVLCIGIGLVTTIRDAGSISQGAELIANKAYPEMKTAGANWLISGCSYGGFCLLWFASFMSELGVKNKLKELVVGMYIGTAAISVAILVVSFGIIANIGDVWNVQIPNLILGEKISHLFAIIFAVVIICGIYTTAVPLLWTPAAKFAEEGTSKFKILTIVLAIVGCVIGLTVPFANLVNIIYVLNGYVGAVLVIFMIAKNIRMAVLRKKKS